MHGTKKSKRVYFFFFSLPKDNKKIRALSKNPALPNQHKKSQKKQSGDKKLKKLCLSSPKNKVILLDFLKKRLFCPEASASRGALPPTQIFQKKALIIRKTARRPSKSKDKISSENVRRRAHHSSSGEEWSTTKQNDHHSRPIPQSRNHVPFHRDLFLSLLSCHNLGPATDKNALFFVRSGNMMAGSGRGSTNINKRITKKPKPKPKAKH